MELSNFLANIWGLSFIIVGLSLLIYQKNIKRVFELAENEINLFFHGVCSFVVGIAMILTHNLWVSDWRVIVTLLGWIALARGIMLLFLPEIVVNLHKKMENNRWISSALVGVVILGCVLIYFGFTA